MNLTKLDSVATSKFVKLIFGEEQASSLKAKAEVVNPIYLTTLVNQIKQIWEPEKSSSRSSSQR